PEDDDDDDDDDVAELADEVDDDVAEDVVATLGNVVGSADLAGTPAPVVDPHRVVWREDWPRYSFDEAILSLGMGALLVAAELLPTATTSANWTGGILFDDGVREGLVLRSPAARDSARVASEALQWVLIGTPFVVDALAAAGIGDGNWDVAFQMGLIALESYIISLVVWKVTVLLARRERPIATACADPSRAGTPECNGDLETTSFFSNEAVNAFTGASLICLHHTHMPLFGDEAADVSACVVGMTAASVVGLLRVMSDREYLTDVLMGAIVGFVAGYIIPWAVHYQGGARPELRPLPGVAIIPAPLIAPGDTYGAMIAGWF
ncbi:MAG: phosphatase PAP2 family protein, partial [Myxococcota bacterium]|nr:phosphatase PAP2 family protein [Myxococcota bacterium]